jgi:hypothetical protein
MAGKFHMPLVYRSFFPGGKMPALYGRRDARRYQPEQLSLDKPFYSAQSQNRETR